MSVSPNVAANATKSLPANYSPSRTIDLSRDKKLALLLNLVGVGLFFVFGVLFWLLAGILRPDLSLQGEFSSGIFLSLLLTIAGVLVLHELIHGLFFWWTTRERPYFGFKLLYAYAAAPDWYIRRNPYLLVGLSPLLLITVLGFLLIPFLTPTGVVLALLGITFNAAGAVGDLFVVFYLLTQPASVLIRDTGDAMQVFRPEPPHP